jgi:chromosome segregation ATPase
VQLSSRMKILNPSQNMAVEVARARLATAENSVQSAKHESSVAKRQRKEAKQAARRAKKRLRRAKEELAEARRVVSEAEKRGREVDGAKAKKQFKTPAPEGAASKAIPKRAQAAKSSVANSASPQAGSPSDPQFPVENVPAPAGLESITESRPAELQESESL